MFTKIKQSTGRLVAAGLVLVFGVSFASAVLAPAAAEAATKKSVLQCASEQPTLSISKNVTHPCVRALQTFLHYFKGYAITVDGIYGLQTAFYVVIYQNQSGTFPDGIVGPNTWNKINGACRNTTDPYKILVCNVQV